MSARMRIAAVVGRAGAARGGRAGFTLVEVLIAVGALGLIAVGISQVFRATGDTVRAGRRISNLNAYAALIERQLREDFDAITRDGFLLIRNERIWRDNEPAGSLIAPANGVPLVPGDTRSARPRRADEVVFFRTGDFVTKRPPAMPDRVARATAARVYIGHGVRRDRSRPSYAGPVRLDDDNTTSHLSIDPPLGLGVNDGQLKPGPNEAASEWTLLRHVTLLAPASASKYDGAAPGVTGSPTANPRLLDGMWQVAGQPAVRSIFRAFNGNAEGTGVYSVYEPDQDEVVHRGLVGLDQEMGPSFATGAIDIATTDLTEIRALIHAAPTISAPPSVWKGGRPGDLDAVAAIDIQDGAVPNDRWPANVPHFPVVPLTIPPDSALAIMHAWMREALPGPSDAPTLDPGDNRGGRIRYEPAPPNPLCIDLAGAGATFAAAAPASVAEREMERGDQIMLSAHNFVPGCSEFIVEWSWGDTYGAGSPQALAGQIVWHGLERAVNLDGNAQYTPQTGERAAGTYICLADGSGVPPGYQGYKQRFVRRDGSIGWRWVQAMLINTNGTGERLPGTGIDENIQYSYFGYINPTYQPAANPDDPTAPPPVPNPGLLVDNATPGVYEPLEGDVLNDPETIPWPWPRLVRITMSLVDPSEPTVEQTYQFIFELPGDPVDPRY